MIDRTYPPQLPKTGYAYLFYFGVTPHGTGTASTREVYYQFDQGQPVELPLCLDIADKSPTGPNWGYNGSGPAQLSIALLAHYFREYSDPLEMIQRYSFAFKEVVIANLKDDTWVLPDEEFDRHLRTIEIMWSLQDDPDNHS